MRRALFTIILGAALAALALFIVLVARSHHEPQTIGLGSAFDGNLQLPTNVIKAAFDSARSNMVTESDHGVYMQFGSLVLAVVSFLLTAAITVIVVFRREGAKHDRAQRAQGQPPGQPAPPAVVEEVEASGLSKRTAAWIAALAATASICGGAGNSLLAASQSRFKRADEIHDTVMRARKQVIDAKTADEAQDVLDDLNLKSSR